MLQNTPVALLVKVYRVNLLDCVSGESGRGEGRCYRILL
jgi:hypothetical protein